MQHRSTFFVTCARVILSPIEPFSNDISSCQSCQSRRVRRETDSGPLGARSAHLVSESLRIDDGVAEEQQLCLAWLVRPWEGLVSRTDERHKMRGGSWWSMVGCYYMCVVLGTGVAERYCGGICDDAVPTYASWRGGTQDGSASRCAYGAEGRMG